MWYNRNRSNYPAEVIVVREKIYQVIEPRKAETKGAKIYDIVMIIVIICSMLPLMFKRMTPELMAIELITVSIFIIDYILRWITADFYLKDRGYKGTAAFLRYPFTPMAILDLLTILPSLDLLFRGFKVIRFIRLVKALRVLRAFRFFRYSKNIERLERVLKKQGDALTTVVFLTAGYIFVTAMIMFQLEPNIFHNFLDAFYWATVSLSTTGYGDIVPMTIAGKVITTCSMLVGMLVIAIPAGIITAGYVEDYKEYPSENSRKEDSEK